MNTEKIIELINSSDLNKMQKNVTIGFINRAGEEQIKKSSDRELIEKLDKGKNITEIILSTDEVKIYKVTGKDEWDIKYPYRSIFVNKSGEWRRITTVSPTLDTAYLVYLQNKHLQINSQFVDFAIKMLEIKLEN